jgi:hypothetical protein
MYGDLNRNLEHCNESIPLIFPRSCVRSLLASSTPESTGLPRTFHFRSTSMQMVGLMSEVFSSCPHTALPSLPQSDMSACSSPRKGDHVLLLRTRRPSCARTKGTLFVRFGLRGLTRTVGGRNANCCGYPSVSEVI